MRVRTRIGIIAVSVLAALAGLAVWLGRPPPPPEPLVIAVAASVFGVPLWVADRQGFLAAEGLQATLRRYPTGKLALEAMLRGEAEVATVAETPLMFAGINGIQYRVIANYASSAEQSVVARADRGIRQVTDLRGRRVATNLGTTGHYVLHVLLSDQGLTEADVELVPLPTPEQAGALAAGQVDAVATFAPYSTQCRHALGDRALTFLTGIRYSGYASLAVAPDFVARRPAATLGLLRALDRAIAWMRAHPQESLALGAAGSGIDPEVLQESFDSIRPNLGLDQGFLVLLQAQARWAIDQRLAPGAAVPDYLDWIDASMLTQLRPEAVSLIQRP
jgi:ABC-type nitrate/sulfonate/bicarbonate transport system substrate-binding protein